MRWIDLRRGRPPTDARAPAPIDVLQQGSESSRRRLLAGAAVAVVLLAAIAVALAWRQYNDAKSQAIDDQRARVATAGAIVDTFFAGEFGTLDAIANAPSIVGGSVPVMTSYFRRADPPGSVLFTGGIAWIDRSGAIQASSNPSRNPRVKVADRQYFRQVLATRAPYVSAGLFDRRTGRPAVVVAVPTFDAKGVLSGVLVGSILLSSVGRDGRSLALGSPDVKVIDRRGQLLLEGLEPVRNPELLRQVRKLGAGVLPSSKGFDGGNGHVVAFTSSKVPGWVTAIDRPRSSVFAAARRALMLELGSVLAGVLLVLGVLVYVTRRVRRTTETQNERARSWTGLTRALASANTPAEVGDALLASLSLAFTNAVAIVGIEDGGLMEVKAASRMLRARRVVESTPTLELAAGLGRERPTTIPLDRQPDLRDLHTRTGRGLRALHAVPISGPGGMPAGTITLLSTAARLEPSEWDLLRSFADQATHALERAWLFVHEHELALRLQRSLLPEYLPSREGASLAGRYLAGGDGVEVGGDWYAAVPRPDGIIHLCVGDVSGRGIGAATVMSRQRHTFEVYAHDLRSPAEIVRRMLRHADDAEMITIAVVSIDPYAGEVTYSCLGHPPPLLHDRETGEVVRLDGASAPPMGVAVPGDVLEATLPLPADATVVLYTDGLIERRGKNIDLAIDLLARLVALQPSPTPEALVAGVGDTIGHPDDDVALLVLVIQRARVSFDVEIPAEAQRLRRLRHRLHAWLAAHGVGFDDAAEIVLAVSEACNNAVEHAYADGGPGSIRVAVSIAESGTLRVVVEDGGTWRDAVPDDERGRGILLMEELMHSTDIETGLTGTRVTLERRLGADPPLAPEPATAGS